MCFPWCIQCMFLLTHPEVAQVLQLPLYFMLNSYKKLYSKSWYKLTKVWKSTIMYCVWMSLCHYGAWMLLQQCRRYPKKKKSLLRVTKRWLHLQLKFDRAEVIEYIFLHARQMIHYLGCYSHMMEVSIHLLLQYRIPAQLSAR